ncbi:hypothetical protein CSKR_203328 [Clonorchis sinensis]|uniref:Uncharacterized protein n=1 Tax=Clonorchis sinensis TaxID=79923 RepID=A0A8T1M9Q3_CLOSI|nr:hypothetical protein CSKR_203328 [Clonorchis sinensis]
MVAFLDEFSFPLPFRCTRSAVLRESTPSLHSFITTRQQQRRCSLLLLVSFFSALYIRCCPSAPVFVQPAVRKLSWSSCLPDHVTSLARMHRTHLCASMRTSVCSFVFPSVVRVSYD